MSEGAVKKRVISGQPCIDKEGCGSSDAMAIYIPEDEEGNNLGENAYCFSCDKSFTKVDIEGLFEEGEGLTKYLERAKAYSRPSGEPITKDQIAEIKKKTSPIGNNYRGIDNETLKFYRVLTEIDGKGKVIKRYYPNSIKSKGVNYQVRVCDPKMFFFIGKAGTELDFFGQRMFSDGGRKRVLIVGGQEDCLAASQMLWEDSVRRGTTKYGREAVVSTPSGENCVKCAKNQYDWLNSFDEIILGLDNDEAGRRAMDSVLPHLPKGKVRVARWSAKDPNDMLLKGMQGKFIDDYHSARKYVPIGILDTSTLHDTLRQTIMLPRLTLPGFMTQLNSMFANGVPFKKIINIAAETSIGKTTLVNEIVYHWMFQEHCTAGIVTLELDAPEYAMALLSRHIGKKISLFDDPSKALEYVNKDWVKAKEHELYYRDNGEPRWYMVEDRSCSVKDVQNKVEELIVGFGCNVIVFDPLSDLISMLPNDEQQKFMTWQKNMKKQHDVIFLNVNHVRGASVNTEVSQDKMRFITENDMMGSKDIPKSADANILANRNKYSDDPLIRNTTELWLPKCRWTGRTGRAGSLYYENDSHTFWDLDFYKDHVQPNGVREA